MARRLSGDALTARREPRSAAFLHSVLRLTMRPFDATSLVAVLALFTLGAGQPPSPSVARLVWLTGCWRQTTGARTVDEQWMAPASGMMLGMSRTVRDGRVTEYEQLRIHERDGRVVYSANPSGQAPADFETSVTGDTLVSFENPAHDFPQRIVYRARGRDSLVARVEGTRGGQLRGFDVAYAREACR